MHFCLFFHFTHQGLCSRDFISRPCDVEKVILQKKRTKKPMGELWLCRRPLLARCALTPAAPPVAFAVSSANAQKRRVASGNKNDSNVTKRGLVDDPAAAVRAHSCFRLPGLADACCKRWPITRGVRLECVAAPCWQAFCRTDSSWLLFHCHRRIMCVTLPMQPYVVESSLCLDPCIRDHIAATLTSMLAALVVAVVTCAWAWCGGAQLCFRSFAKPPLAPIAKRSVGGACVEGAACVPCGPARNVVQKATCKWIVRSRAQDER